LGGGACAGSMAYRIQLMRHELHRDKAKFI
jgi:hypothetical protein